MKSHPFDLVSFIFGTIFLLVALGFGFLTAILDLRPGIPFGYLLPAGIIAIGLWVGIGAVLKTGDEPKPLDKPE